jgi:hypothetical protein
MNIDMFVNGRRQEICHWGGNNAWRAISACSRIGICKSFCSLIDVSPNKGERRKTRSCAVINRIQTAIDTTKATTPVLVLANEHRPFVSVDDTKTVNGGSNAWKAISACSQFADAPFTIIVLEAIFTSSKIGMLFCRPRRKGHNDERCRRNLVDIYFSDVLVIKITTYRSALRLIDHKWAGFVVSRGNFR